MPTKKISTSSSAKRQTLGKAIPDSGRAAIKRMSGTYPSPTSESTPLGDQTNGATSTSASRRNSTATGATFAREFNLPTLLAHIQALTKQLEEMQSQVETWQGHAISFRDQRDQLRKTLLQLSEQRWIMQYNQARGRPLDEVPPLSELPATMRSRAETGRSRSPSSPTASTSSNTSPPPTGGMTSSFNSMAMDVEAPESRPSSAGPSSSQTDRRRGSASSASSSGSNASDLKRSDAETDTAPSDRRLQRPGTAGPSSDPLSHRRVTVERADPSEPRQRSVQWETMTRFVPHPARGLEDPNVAPAPYTPAPWAKS